MRMPARHPGMAPLSSGAGAIGAAGTSATAPDKFAHGIDRLVLRLIIRARQQFANQSDGNKSDPADHQHGGHDDQRESDGGSGHETRQSGKAKKLQRARRVIQQKLDAEQVEENADRARDAVVRFPILASNIGDGHLGHGRAGPAGERRYEAVQLAVQLDFGQYFAAIGLERGAEVVQVHARKLGHDPVGDAAGQLAGQKGVGALHAPAAHDVVPLLNFFDESRNFGGIVLQVAVHGNDDLAAGVIEPSFQRGGLPEIAAKPDDRHARVIRGNFGEQAERSVLAAVIDEYNLVRFADGVHGVDDADV